MSHAEEVARGERFAFGENWARFLDLLDEERITLAKLPLCDMMEADFLAGRSFVDVGSDGGLYSLAARRLGARVHSFDVDSRSVACTSELKRRYFPGDPYWVIEEGSTLDPGALERIGRFDILYSWGVLHHTGDLWTAPAKAERLPAPGARLFIAIYYDQGRASGRWLAIEKAYNRLPASFRWPVVLPAPVRVRGPSMLRGLFRLQSSSTRRQRGNQGVCGMDPWRDSIEWIGGLPFEETKPAEIFDCYRRHGFDLKQSKTCAGRIG